MNSVIELNNIQVCSCSDLSPKNIEGKNRNLTEEAFKNYDVK